MDNKKSYVYKITCKITGEFYFGSSFRAKSDKYWGGGKRIRERIAQYGKQNFVKEILEEFDDRVEALQVENQYIEKFRNDEKCLNQMLNRHFGSYNDETRAKMSASHLGKYCTDEVRAKISAALCGEKSPWYGKNFSEEHRSKISAAKRGEKSNFFGKHHTEEVKAKISAAHIGNTNVRGKHWRKNPVTGKREYYD